MLNEIYIFDKKKKKVVGVVCLKNRTIFFKAWMISDMYVKYAESLNLQITCNPKEILKIDVDNTCYKYYNLLKERQL